MTRGSGRALVIIDMQRDFCAAGGWVDQLGEGYANTARPIPVLVRVLAAARAVGMPVVFTREGHLRDLSDLPAAKRWRTRGHGLGIGDMGREGRILVRGEPGWQIVPELAPLASEHLVDKPGKSSFWQTDFEHILTEHAVGELYVTGVTTDCCVQSTIRDAFDRGYACTVITDAVAAVEQRNHNAHLRLLTSGRIRFARALSSEQFVQETA